MTHKVTICHVSFMLKSDRSLCEENNLTEDKVSSIKSMSCSCKQMTISLS